MNQDRFSRTVFLAAGIYGMIVLLPGFFSEKMIAEIMPPAITHPEFYYGFFGVALAWQVAFLIIARDPQRFRPIIPAAILEKLIYVAACAVLLLSGRIPPLVALGGAGDFILGALFIVSYLRLKDGAAVKLTIQHKGENALPTHIERPTRIQAAGNMPKLIDEYIGYVNSPADKVLSKKDPGVSVAHMRSPAGWQEPGQTPEFEEYTIVLKGRLCVNHKGGSFEVVAGQAVIAHPGEWVQYSTPDEATEYIAICRPAFSPQTVHRDEAP